VSVLKDLICPVCKTRGIPITSAAWIASWTPVWVSADTHCRACGANVRFPVVSQPVGWMLTLPCMVLIGIEMYYVTALSFLLAPLTLVAFVFVPPLFWKLQPVVQEEERADRWDGICPVCGRPGVPYKRIVWELWAVHGRTRCGRCGSLVRLSHWAGILATFLFTGVGLLVLWSWFYLSTPLSVLVTVALPVAGLALPPRWLRLHAVRKRE